MLTLNLARLIAGVITLLLLSLGLLIFFVGHPLDAGAVMTAASVLASAWHHLHLECVAARRRGA
jgi:uncharacterized MnhB-related membrane protein